MPYFFRKSKAEVQTTDGVGNFFVEILKVAIISLAIIIPIRYFLIQPFVVRGSSMEPSFSSGDYLIIDEISYRFSEPQRGDVIVFEYPRNPSQYYIKRIIGLPGERVQVDNGEVVIYNTDYPGGVGIEESYLIGADQTPGNVDTTLGSEEYFVLGDNRTASSDSRVWGELESDRIIGRAWVRGWPVKAVGTVQAPIYKLIGN
ncbi:signal peptidase I [Patescibacteria group bacterium]|nr:signal peptidase I [Patescibacteria group bacterium]